MSSPKSQYLDIKEVSNNLNIIQQEEEFLTITTIQKLEFTAL